MCEGGKGGNVLPLFYKRGQMSTIIHLLGGGGANVLPCQSFRGQMSSYTIFHRGADVRGGKCPAPATRTRPYLS